MKNKLSKALLALTILGSACLLLGCIKDEPKLYEKCDNAGTNSALDLSKECDIFNRIWGPGSNGIEIGGGLNFSTEPGVGHSQEYGGIYVTSYSITGVNSYYLTEDYSRDIKIEGPLESIIEVWDLETLKVIKTNITSPGTVSYFTALPNRRYGGFAWYSDNAKKSLSILASYK